MSEVNAEAIKKQVEFYFSDSNFRKDVFLKNAAQADPCGYVPIETLLTFNRLKALTTDPAVVADCLKHSDAVDVSEDGLKIKRSSELPENDNSAANTLYVKGYPTDDADVTIDSVSKQFSEFGKVCLVHLRRDKLSKGFKGGCFVEFESEQSVHSAVAAAHEGNEVKMGYKGVNFLCVMPYTEWRKRKELKRRPNKESCNSANFQNAKRKLEDAESTDAKQKVEYTSGLIFKIKDLPTDSTVYEIKDFFKNISDIKFVDYEGGSTEAFVRAADVEATATIQKALDVGVPLRESGSNITYEVLAGEEEETYWEKIASKSKSNVGGGRGGGRGGRGGRGRGGGRGFKRGRKN